MTNANTIPYHNSYGVCSPETSSLKIISKARKKAKKEKLELAFLIALLFFGNVFAISKCVSVSFGFFGCFLTSVLVISLVGIISGTFKKTKV